MQPSHSSLAALVGSRLCHDLISPIGAIRNGLELLTLTGNGQTSAEMALIEDSCASAAARIRFFRVAFGGASEGQKMGQREILSCLEDLTKGGKIRASWQPEGDIPRAVVQLTFLAYLCCETALPQGGALSIENGRDRWKIEALAPRVLVDETLWGPLGKGEAPQDVSADRVQFALLALLAKERGKLVRVQTGTEAVRIEIRDA